MLHKTTGSQIGILGIWTPIVGIGIDADAATGREKPDDLDVLGIHQAHKVLHDDVNAVFMKVAVITE